MPQTAAASSADRSSSSNNHSPAVIRAEVRMLRKQKNTVGRKLRGENEAVERARDEI